MLILNVSPTMISLSGATAQGSSARGDSADAAVPAQPRPPGSAIGAKASGQLTPAQQNQVEQLKQIDLHVREHEQAHLRAGHGIVTSGPSYTYTYGPDGKAYATAGEVAIDTGAENKPQANIDKGLQIQAAALAPSDPSPQDYRVAAAGEELASRGRTDLVAEQRQARAAAESQTKAAGAQSGQAQPQPQTASTKVSMAYSVATLATTSAGSLLNTYA